MSSGDPQERFFYPTLTLTIDSYIIESLNNLNVFLVSGEF